MDHSIGPVQAALMLLAGIFTGLNLHLSPWIAAALFAAGLAGGVFFYRQGKDFVLDQLPKKLARIFFSLALFAAGMGRASFTGHHASPGSVDHFIGQRISGIIGYITSPPVVSNARTTLRVRLDSRQEAGSVPNEGKLLLIFYHDPGIEFHYGDRLSISGEVKAPPDSVGNFSYRTYLERNGIRAMINNPAVKRLDGFSGNPLFAGIYRLRSFLVNRIYELFPSPEGPLMAGILLGDESKITSAMERDFQETGTAHIIAISGANFTLLTLVLLSMLQRLVPHWWAPLLMIPFIAFYTILVGGNSAVVRAAIMCVFTILGSVRGRTGNGVNNLALTAAIMCLWNPNMIYDLGFQLSATAALGILLFSDPLCDLMKRILGKVFPKMSEASLTGSVGILNDLCLMSVCAQVFTLWIIAQAYGRISLISLPANFLIAPFQPMIMLGGFLTLLLSCLFYPLGLAAAWVVWAAPALTIRIVQSCAGISWGKVYFDLSAVQAWLIIALIIALWSGRNMIAGSIQQRNFRPYAALVLLFLAVMVWTNAADRLDRRTEIEFRSTSSSLKLRIRSRENRDLIIADNLTNYGAQDLLKKQVLPIPRKTEAAWLEIPENWMVREFTASGAAEGLSLLSLNGMMRKGAGEDAERMTDGSVYILDDVILHFITGYLGKRCWLVESGGLRLLFPNGVPPKRIFTPGQSGGGDISLAVLGKRDSKEIWEEYLAENVNRSALQLFTAPEDITLIIRDGQLSYR